MTPTKDSTETLTVLYDGSCPLCRREIAHVRTLSERQEDGAMCFIDISQPSVSKASCADDRARLLARFHVQRADGSMLSGAAAFVAMWDRLPGWRWLARFARLPGMLILLEAGYRVFLWVRPGLQAVARRIEARTTTQGQYDAALISKYLERELRSDHAGETGAVFIYRGISAVATRRGDPELIEFAKRHGETEAEHLRLVEDWLPPSKRSRLLGPWRVAGWLTGALPALAGRRAVYATIAAVETFVDQHYQQQIDHLRQHPGPDGLLKLLERCQADERHHRDEATALARQPNPWLLRAWCAIVGAGSAAAVVLARRV
jgi:demethoxyubiquinone hydroxylase (CLK1/Coq7/Cat5 family)